MDPVASESDGAIESVATQLEALRVRVDKAKAGAEARAAALAAGLRPGPRGSPARSAAPADGGSPGRRLSRRSLLLGLVLVLIGGGVGMTIAGDDRPDNRESDSVAITEAAERVDRSLLTADDEPATVVGGPVSQDPVPQDPGAAPAPAPASAPASEVAAATTVVVEAGDSFWRIAEDVVSSRGEAPTTAQVASYWVDLVEANRSGLVDAGNPDLIHAGQTVALP